jgi:hypothetical protein
VAETQTKLILETRDHDMPNKGIVGGGIMMTPPIAEDYWYFRVKLGRRGQAILGFPKFGTVGIGFAEEVDWNTNLPFLSSAQRIYKHIHHNKGRGIRHVDCLAAIEMVREAARQFKGLSDEEWASEQARIARGAKRLA